MSKDVSVEDHLVNLDRAQERIEQRVTAIEKQVKAFTDAMHVLSRRLRRLEAEAGIARGIE